MDNDKINTITDLYKRVMPALKSKRRELTNKKLGMISESLIFECLRETKWQVNKSGNLTLYDVVSDILNISDEELVKYVARRKGDSLYGPLQ